MARTLLVMFTIMIIGFGCSEQPTKETVGTGAGAAIGGMIGSEVGDGTTGTVVGGVLGALIGREVGRRMDEQDRANARTAFEENRTVNWDNPDTDTEYTVQPTDTFERDGPAGATTRPSKSRAISKPPPPAGGTTARGKSSADYR